MKNRFVLGLLVLVCVASFAFAAGRAQPLEATARVAGYRLSAVTAAYRTSLSTGDNASGIHANNLALDKIYCGGYQTVSCAAHLASASATVVIRCVRYTSADAVKSQTRATATADDADTDGTKYLSDTLYFDTEGAPYVRFLVETPSAGSVDLWAEVN